MAEPLRKYEACTDLEPESDVLSTAAAGNHRLDKTAGAVGSALGNATRRLKQMKNRFILIQGGRGRATAKAEQLKTAVSAGARSAQVAVQAATNEAAAKVRKVGEDAGMMMKDVKAAASQRITMTRSRLVQVVDEHPLQVIAGVGGSAFLLGIFLRVWRSNHE